MALMCASGSWQSQPGFFASSFPLNPETINHQTGMVTAGGLGRIPVHLSSGVDCQWKCCIIGASQHKRSRVFEQIERTLVIHPKDKSTDFLKVIYANKPDWTVVTGNMTTEDVNDLITQHDHIIMMGHGTPQGLLSVGQFNKPKPKVKPQPKTVVSAAPGKSLTKQDDITAFSSLDEDDWFFDRQVGSRYGGNYQSTASYVKEYTTGYIIDDKTVPYLRGKKLTTIWCNADQFIEWNELGGFYTGMFISETSEAQLIGTAGAAQWQVDESNYGFVSVVQRFIDQSADVLLAALKLEYGKMAEYNPVARYNYRRLYVGEEGNVRDDRQEESVARISGRKARSTSDRPDGRATTAA